MRTRPSVLEAVRWSWLIGLLLGSCAAPELRREPPLPPPRELPPAPEKEAASADLFAASDASVPAISQDESACKAPAVVTSELALAALVGDIHGVKDAIARGAPVDERFGDEPTPLMMALATHIAEPDSSEAKEKARRVRKLKIAKQLLAKGADVRLADGNGTTALHRVASSYDSDQVVEEWIRGLLEAGASIDARTCLGETPAMVATRAGRPRVAELLNAVSVPTSGGPREPK